MLSFNIHSSQHRSYQLEVSTSHSSSHSIISPLPFIPRAYFIIRSQQCQLRIQMMSKTFPKVPFLPMKVRRCWFCCWQYVPSIQQFCKYQDWSHKNQLIAFFCPHYSLLVSLVLNNQRQIVIPTTGKKQRWQWWSSLKWYRWRRLGSFSKFIRF